MKLLLDTHAALWWTTDDPELSGLATSLIEDPTNAVLLSAVVPWEIAIKRSIGKLRAPDGVVARLLEGGASRLPISLEHAAAVEHLPPHHRDPFDRLLIAQAMAEGATIVTRDVAFDAYAPPTAW